VKKIIKKDPARMSYRKYICRVVLHFYFGVQTVLISTWMNTSGLQLCKWQLMSLMAVVNRIQKIILLHLFSFTVSDLADQGRTLSICGCFILVSLSGTAAEGD